MIDNPETDDRVMRAEVSTERMLESGILVRSRDFTIAARTTGSRSPSTNASIKWRDEMLHTPGATEVNLMMASWNVFCGRGISHARADMGLEVAVGLAQLAHRRRWNERGQHHAVRGHSGQVLCVGQVGRTPRHVLHTLRVAQPQLGDRTSST